MGTIQPSKAGYSAISATSGSEAVQLASGIALDTAVVDMDLPGIDGIQTAVEICKKLPNCRILLMTVHMDWKQRLEHASRDGINFSVMFKPIPPAELLQALEAATPPTIREIVG